LKNAVIIGSGFAGLSTACFDGKAGWKVTKEKAIHPPGNGKANAFRHQGFTLTWAQAGKLMPDVFEHFNCFDKTNEVINSAGPLSSLLAAGLCGHVQ
jgi:phytoene desaturase